MPDRSRRLPTMHRASPPLKKKTDRRLARWVLALTSSVAAPTVLAWDFSGFASLGAGYLDQHEYTFADYNDRLSFDTDTIVGVQLQGELSNQWSLTTQVASRGYRSDGHHDYQPELEWLFLTYQGSNGMSVRAGRLRTPFFLHSEDLEVGYAYPWVRPPVDVYALNVTPFANYEGLEVAARHRVFDADLDTQLFAGAHKEKYLGTSITAHAMYGLAANLQQDSWIARISALNWLTDYTNPGLDQLRDGLDQVAGFVPSFVGTGDLFGVDNQWIQYYSLGGQWEPGTWLLMAEGSYIDGPEKGLSSSTYAGYFSVAYQIERWQPYATISRLRSYVHDHIERAIIATYQPLPTGVPAGTNSDLDLLREGALQVVEGTRMVETVYAAGIRFDVAPRFALKAQVDQFHFSKGSPGQMLFRGDGPYSDHAMLYSLAVDTVF